jgi:methionyl-tRNA formyltransferase
MTTGPRLRILFFGMRCAFSVPPLEALIHAGHEIAGVVLPGPSFAPPIVSQLPATVLRLSASTEQSVTVDALASRVSSPVLTIGDLRQPGALAALQATEPDLIVVACFTSLLPPEVLAIPRLGGVNVHPSLLPRGRGPEPLFWSFRRGERETGVTVHRMTERFDAGTILRQERVPIDDGIRLPDLELQLAKLGGKLLVHAIDQLSTDSALPVLQDETQATLAPIPSDADYEVPTNLPARWAFNFARAVAPTTNRLRIVIMSTKQSMAVADAVAFSAHEKPSKPLEISENLVVIAFQPGSVTFVLPQTG